MPRGVYDHHKIRGRTKENDLSRAAQAAKIAGRTKENDLSVAARAAKAVGRRNPGKGTFYSGSKTIYCPECGKGHLVPLNSIKKFCDKSCTSSFYNKLRGLQIQREIRVCICGCGETFKHKVGSTRKFKNRKHYERWMKNNCIDRFDHSKPIWNKNLTKETDERVKKNSEATRLGVLNLWQDPEYIEKHIGKNHPAWIDGSTIIYPLEFNRVLRESIRERDDRICQLCGKIEENNGQKLAIHHIDYDKGNCNSDNLISLCVSCHTKTNFNREYWIEFFQLKFEDSRVFI